MLFTLYNKILYIYTVIYNIRVKKYIGIGYIKMERNASLQFKIYMYIKYVYSRYSEALIKHIMIL